MLLPRNEYENKGRKLTNILQKKKKKDVSEYSLESANQLLVCLWVKPFFGTISGANLGGI